MNYNPEIHHRRSIRLKGYDYSQEGAYFVTVCTQNREYRFGGVVNGEMVLNDAGRMVRTIWRQIPQNYPGITTDAFVIMPNHVHGIIIVGAIPRDCPPCERNDPHAIPRDCSGAYGGDARQPQGVAGTVDGREQEQPQGVAPTGGLSLPDVVQRFKSLTTKYYIDGVKQRGWRPFPGKLWQRNYYEHVIRSMDDLYEPREYIMNNPLQWEWDRENPERNGEGFPVH